MSGKESKQHKKYYNDAFIEIFSQPAFGVGNWIKACAEEGAAPHFYKIVLENFPKKVYFLD
jgi:hypothetical protein